MTPELRLLDVDSLKQIYATESEKLQSCLFNGAVWEEVTAQRHRLIECEIVLHQRLRFSKPSVSRSFGRA